MAGFFDDEEIKTHSRSSVGKFLGCSSCGLHRGCLSPRMKATGDGEMGTFVLAEAPGELEDRRNTQLIGEAGQLLRRYLKKEDIDLDRDIRKMNAVNCRPPKNATPKDPQIASCRERVLEEIESFQPKIIALLGGIPIKSIIGNYWRKDVGGINRWRGYCIPDRNYNAWILPLYHPSYINREEKGHDGAIITRIFEQDIHQLAQFMKKTPPLPTYPKEQEQIELIYKPEKIMKYLRGLLRRKPKLVAFDYETTGRKPHREGHDIICASISEGEEATVAFPLLPEIRRAFCEFLITPQIHKIAANMKFERAWSWVILKCSVEGFFWDTMIEAHINDNRKEITSLKYQAYVNYGISDYDSHIHPFLKGADDKDGNSFNRIHEVPMKELLLYCGMDSLLERRLALDQMKKVGISL